jgi:hypothetical protein
MTPRHPPRALRSLTTPIRPPHPGRRPRRAGNPAATTKAAGPSPRLARGRGVSRRGAPSLRVTISLSVRVHCCGEKDSATTTLAWLSCLRDQPPNCQRATGRAPDGAGGSPPSRLREHPDWPPARGRGRTRSAPPRTRRYRCHVGRHRSIAFVQPLRGARDGVPRSGCPLRCEPTGEAGGMTGGRQRRTVPTRPRYGGPGWVSRWARPRAEIF